MSPILSQVYACTHESESLEVAVGRKKGINRVAFVPMLQKVFLSLMKIIIAMPILTRCSRLLGTMRKNSVFINTRSLATYFQELGRWGAGM